MEEGGVFSEEKQKNRRLQREGGRIEGGRIYLLVEMIFEIPSTQQLHHLQD